MGISCQVSQVWIKQLMAFLQQQLSKPLLTPYKLARRNEPASSTQFDFPIHKIKACGISVMGSYQLIPEKNKCNGNILFWLEVSVSPPTFSFLKQCYSFPSTFGSLGWLAIET